MSLKGLAMQLQTGLSEREWEALWVRLVSSAQFQVEALSIGFEEWREMVINEGHNRRFVTYAFSGKRIGLRKGIAQVVAEIREDIAKGMIRNNDNSASQAQNPEAKPS